jgi:predicted aminopeptidase
VVVELILKHRQLLSEAYKLTASTDKKANVKKQQFEALRAEYKQLRQQGGGSEGYDRWFAKPLNNASLVLFGDYHGWVSAFENLFERSGKDWSRFYEAAEDLSKLPKAERNKQLEALN